MSRFTLTGLLRARTAQEEQARRDLGSAGARVAGANATVQHREAALASAGPVPDGAAALFLAGVAARAGLAASVNEALAVSRLMADEMDDARRRWLQARMRMRAVERLAERDRLLRQQERARAEQVLSDDLSGARHHTREDDGLPS